jgi:hypothetical protein
MHSQSRSLNELLATSRIVANMWSDSTVYPFCKRQISYRYSWSKVGNLKLTYHDVPNRFSEQTLSDKYCTGRALRRILRMQDYHVHFLEACYPGLAVAVAWSHWSRDSHVGAMDISTRRYSSWAALMLKTGRNISKTVQMDGARDHVRIQSQRAIESVVGSMKRDLEVHSTVDDADVGCGRDFGESKKVAVAAEIVVVVAGVVEHP